MSAQLYKALCSRLLQTDFTKHEELCCLCLKPAGEDATSVDDEVVLSLGTKQQPIRKNIWNILKLVLDESFTEVMYILTLVCKECMNTAIAGYKFIKGCKTNANILYEALEKLEDSFDITDNAFNYKTMYVAIHPEEISKTSLIRQYYDKRCHFIPQDTALPRFQMILESLHPRTSLCSKTDIESKDILFDPEKPNDYKCIICQQQFTDSACLRIHFFRKHHHKSDVKCKECNIFSTTEFNFGNNNFEENCMGSDIDPQTNQEHLEYTGSPESDQDFEETPTVESEVVLINTAAQLENVSREQIYTCFDCNRTYKDISVYTRHKKRKCRKEKQGNFYCDHCKRKFSYRTSLSQHIRNQHMPAKCHLCELCGKNFSRNSRLKYHTMTVHTNEPKKKIECPHCGKLFKKENYLEAHIAIHSEERPYTCDFCGQPFKKEIHLQSHVIRKHKPPTFPCDLCDRSYFTQSELTRHKKKHFGNYKEVPTESYRKYICEYCNKGFKTSGKLKEHVKRHKPPTEECNICHKKFRARADLRIHLRRHYNVESSLHIEKDN